MVAAQEKQYASDAYIEQLRLNKLKQINKAIQKGHIGVSIMYLSYTDLLDTGGFDSSVITR
ncbi:MAG: hypothetical protein ACI9QD_001138 [Thermoproteota archaeon]|jgi:hypothetical protein